MTLSLESIKLISFNICPFVVRSQIIAYEKKINIETVYIDLSNMPEWFLSKSPTQTVPALLVDNSFIFESSVICDFIDSLEGTSLYPKNIVLKHINKSWIEYASSVIFSQYEMYMSRDLDSYNDKKEVFSEKLSKIENILKNKPFFNGDYFSIIDAAYAPLLYRLKLSKELFSDNTIHNYKKISQWSEAVTDRKSVKEYMNDNFNKDLISHLKENNSILTR